MQPNADFEYMGWLMDPLLNLYRSVTPLGDYSFVRNLGDQYILHYENGGRKERLGSYPSSEAAKYAAHLHYTKLKDKENDKMVISSHRGILPEEFRQIEDAVKENLKKEIATKERLQEDIEKQRAELARKESMLNLKIALASAALRDAGHNHMADFISARDADAKEVWSAVKATNIAK